MEVTIAGADTHPPPHNSFTLGRLLFHNLSQRAELGDCSPPPASLLAPLPLVLGFTLPPSMGEEWGYVWAVSFPQSTGGLPWSVWGWGSIGGGDKA